MNKVIDDVQKWLKQLEEFNLPKWESLPDLDLYMDQVITYLERVLSPLAVEEHDKIITPFMINNYVKGNLIPSPVAKKYSKEHIGFMLGICSVKQILSISDIAKLKQRLKTNDIEAFYQIFIMNWQDNLHNIAANANEVVDEVIAKYKGENLEEEIMTESIKDNLNYLALKLAIEAEAKKIIADKLLYLLNETEVEEKDKGKRKGK